MARPDRPTVLAVDDDPALRELFTHWLEAHGCIVSTAADGEEALDRLSPDVDVVLLDRRMPGPSGDEVLERVRERGYRCRVAMVTAVEPDVDVVEMGFDSYLRKPVDREDLERTVDRLLERSSYEANQREYFALAEKRAALELHHSASELDERPEYRALVERLAELEADLAADAGGFDDEDFVVAYRNIGGPEAAAVRE
jgi:DNA-binding response OmpR family regulator